MRQQKITRLKKNQQGYILVTVLALMVLISLMVIASYTSTSTSLKTSAYDADKKYATTLAEQATNIAAQETANLFADPNSDLIPPITDYNQAQYPTIFTELLEDGERLKTIDDREWPQYFTNSCAGIEGKYKGLCAPSVQIKDKIYGSKDGRPAAARDNVFNEYSTSNKSCGNSIEIKQDLLPNDAARNPCYIIEFLGINPERILRYRITVIAWGKKNTTTTKIESTFEMNYD